MWRSTGATPLDAAADMGREGEREGEGGISCITAHARVCTLKLQILTMPSKEPVTTNSCCCFFLLMEEEEEEEALSIHWHTRIRRKSKWKWRKQREQKRKTSNQGTSHERTGRLQNVYRWMMMPAWWSGRRAERNIHRSCEQRREYEKNKIWLLAMKRVPDGASTNALSYLCSIDIGGVLKETRGRGLRIDER